MHNTLIILNKIETKSKETKKKKMRKISLFKVRTQCIPYVFQIYRKFRIHLIIQHQFFNIDEFYPK